MAVKKSAAYERKLKRMKELKKLGPEILRGQRKKDAAVLIQIFHYGITNDIFGLRRLEKMSIEHKKAMGYSDPAKPLFGAGDDEKDRSYMNMFHMEKLKNGWKVYPSVKKHHTANMQLRQLLMIHEYGCLIKQPNGNVIRIPPRPAWMIAKRKFAKMVSAKSKDKDFKKAMTEFINDGKSKYFDKMLDILNNQYNDLIE